MLALGLVAPLFLMSGAAFVSPFFAPMSAASVTMFPVVVLFGLSSFRLAGVN